MKPSPVRLASLATAFLVLGHGPAASQEVLSDAMSDLTSPDAIASSASKLAEQGASRLLVTNMLDQQIKGSDGNTIGTVRDFAVIPGGRMIAAIVEMENGTRVAIPYGAVKVAGSAQDFGLTVPVEASQIQDMDELGNLAKALGGN